MSFPSEQLTKNLILEFLNTGSFEGHDGFTDSESGNDSGSSSEEEVPVPGEDNNLPPREAQMPFFNGCPVKIEQLMTLLMGLYLRFNWTAKALEGTLKTVGFLSRIFTYISLYRFFKFFSRLKFPIERIHYCETCHQNFAMEGNYCNACETITQTRFF